MELADLTRGMRKNDFLEPEKLFFCKAGWSEFHKVSVQKNNFLEPEKFFFAKLGWSEFHKVSVQKHFFRA